MKLTKYLLVYTLIVLIGHTVQAQNNTYKKHLIVMQLTSADTMVHKGLIKQLNNLKTGWGDTVNIEVVCHGPGIELLMSNKSRFSQQISQLQQKGIDFVACENTMLEKKINKIEILPNMIFVHMGIGEIILKQEQGWHYIKAGN
jgi:intracellular sulfur oxidation DsrE/DsrF family protein